MRKEVPLALPWIGERDVGSRKWKGFGNSATETGIWNLVTSPFQKKDPLKGK